MEIKPPGIWPISEAHTSNRRKICGSSTRHRIMTIVSCIAFGTKTKIVNRSVKYSGRKLQTQTNTKKCKARVYKGLYINR